MPKKSSNWRPRLAVDVPADLHFTIQRLCPFGTRKIIINKLLKDFVDLCESTGQPNTVIAAILDGKLGLGYCKIEELFNGSRPTSSLNKRDE